MSIKIENLSIYDKQQLLVNNLEFSLTPNIIHALVGESGSGKTLTGKYLLGQHFPNLSYNIEKFTLPAKLMKKAWIPQNSHESLNPLMNIKAQILQIQSANKSKSNLPLSFEELFLLLKSVKLISSRQEAKLLLQKTPNQLSGGMKQRILILMSFVSNANFILADEPTSALDSATAMESLTVFRDLFLKKQTAQEHKYALIISHDLHSLRNIADYIDVMYAGQIIESGTTKEILNTPKHPYTQALLNSIPKSKTKTFKVMKGQLEKQHIALEGCSFAPRCDNFSDECNKKIAKEKRIRNQETQSYYRCLL